MDYCHPCRRHLNGALTCAGCGAPAEGASTSGYGESGFVIDGDIGLIGHAPGPDTGDTGDTDTGPRPGSRTESRAAGRRKPSNREPSNREPSGRRPSRRAPRKAPGQGRRARDRRGRRVLIGTLGVVLAAGMLSLAQLAFEAPGRDHAASVKEDTSVLPDGGSVDGDTDRPAAPDDPGPAVSPGSGSASGDGAGPSVDGSAAPVGGGDPDADRSSEEEAPAPPGASSSAEAVDGDGTDPAAPGSGGPEPGGAGTTGPGDPAGRPTGEPTGESDPATPTSAPPPPAPEPEPSETCVRFLWWCT
ncbi:hypothetical protein ACIQ7D_18430 [Streptomyces sp. NPDC096310]|uniref:SCO2400 family protein n=1 Tax=Streptomyces sp. NPDC096310 TaxID=3366082 RepID=UPI00380BB1F5